MAPRQKQEMAEIQILEIQQGQLEIFVVGTGPLCCNKKSQQVLETLLYPRPRMTAYDKATKLKHNPPEEFRNSIYRLPSDEPTLIGMKSVAFKGAIANAALDLPGAQKSQIARLTYVIGDYVPIYGIPKLHMGDVVSSDIKRTPDIRTRAMLGEWAARFVVSYVQPLLNPGTISNLAAAAGVFAGIGDGRPQKGKLNYGTFRLVKPNDPDYLRIAKYGGRKAQEAAMQACEPYNEESRELLNWWTEEVQRRKYEKAPAKDEKPSKAKAAAA